MTALPIILQNWKQLIPSLLAKSLGYGIWLKNAVHLHYLEKMNRVLNMTCLCKENKNILIDDYAQAGYVCLLHEFELCKLVIGPYQNSNKIFLMLRI